MYKMGGRCKLGWLLLSLFICPSCASVFTPVFYKVALDFSKFSFQNNRMFDGETTIYLNVAPNTYGVQQIILDAEMLKILEVNVVDVDTNKNVTVEQGMGIKDFKYTIVVKLDNAAKKIKAIINYQGHVGNVGDTGVYMADQQNVIATNTYPLGARKIFPCQIDPSVRTPFKFDVKLVNKYWGIHHLTNAIESPFLPTHAVGFIMTYKYRKADDISTDRFNVWVPNNDIALYDSVNGNRALWTILKKGSYFDGFFGPAHLDVIHIVMVPGLKQPSVVNHRLIALRPDFLVFSEIETAEMAKGSAVAMLNALSKHFFRCVSSPKSWEDFWLSDSTALYLQYALLNDTFNDPYYPEMFITDVQRPAMRSSSLQVNPKIVDPSILITDGIYPSVYQGASILKMLEVLSDQKEVLKDFFNYFKTYKYTNVDTQQFLDYMSKGSFFKQLNSYGKTLSPILDGWLHITGYPFLTDVSIESDGFSLTQNQLMGSIDSSTRWIFPFMYRDSFQDEGKLIWLSGEKSKQFKVSGLGSWLELNINSKGMFRVNYGNNLELLLPDSVYWKLSGSERAALIDDAYEMAKMNIDGIDLGYALVLTDTIGAETDYVAFSLAMSHVNTLRHLYGQKGLSKDFEVKVGGILVETYSRASWSKKEPVSFGKTMWTRSVVESACQYNVLKCLAHAGSSFHSKILSDLIPTVNCYQVWKSKESDWKKYFTKFYSNSSTQYARADALYALACPENLEVDYSTAISEYLNTINSDAILEEDALKAFQYIYSHPQHINQTFNYIRDNFSSLLSRFNDDFMANLISSISQLLLPEYYSGFLDNLKARLPATSKTYKAIVNSLSDMETREKFVVSNMNQVIHWLQNNSTTYRPLPPPTTIPPNGGPTTPKNSGAVFTLNIFAFLSSCFIVFKFFH